MIKARTGTVNRVISSLDARITRRMPAILYRAKLDRVLERGQETRVPNARDEVMKFHNPVNAFHIPKITRSEQSDVVVSFIIPSFNAGRLLAECVDSIYGSIGLPEYEVIVVDDGSTDNTPQIARSLAERYDNLRVVSKCNGGAGFARNSGMELARGEYFCFIDADDMVEASWFVRCFDALKTNVADYSYSLMTRIDASGKHQLGIAGKSRKNGTGLSGCAAIFRRNVWDDIAFPEGVWYEDAVIDYCVAPRFKGAFVEDAGYLYRYHGNAVSSKSGLSNCAVDAYWIVEILLNWCQQIKIENNLDMYCLTLEKLGPVLLHWTNGLPDEARSAIFMLSCDLLSEMFGEFLQQTACEGRLCDLENAFRLRNFRAWELVCKAL